MFNIGPGELVVILIVALIVLGPKNLPDVARTVGKGMRELRRATEDIKDTVEGEFYKLEHPESEKPALRPPAGRTVPIEQTASTSGASPAEPPGAGSAPQSGTNDPGPDRSTQS
jgi:sec-independent protein translocase protein TatB